ncbi:MAG: hypothetical protein ACI4RT_02340 [Candidatus Spyradenecus sp.]
MTPTPAPQATPTPLTTTLNREYALRLLGVAVLFIGLSGWFLYDGARGYPAENAAVAPVAAELAQQPLTPADWVNTAKTGTVPLIDAFQARGLKAPSKFVDGFTSWVRAGDPKGNDPQAAAALLRQPVHSPEDIRTQFISAGIGLLAAAGLLALLAWRRLTTLRLEPEALVRTVAGRSQRFALAELRDVDDREWTKRGIARARFATGTVTLDAWHHAGIREIHARLVERAPATGDQQ